MIYNLSINTEDDNNIRASFFSASSQVHTTVIINSAIGLKRQYYNEFATYLANKGFDTITYDYRGIGDSRPESLKGFEVHMAEWGQIDLTAVINWIRENNPDTKLYIIGHSAGGQLVGLSPEAGDIDGMIFVAVQNGYWGNWQYPEKAYMWSLWHVVMPLFTHTCGYFPSKKLKLGEDLPKDVALEWADWCKHDEYLFSDDELAEDSYYDDIRVPILAYSFTDDEYAPSQAVDNMLKFYRNADIDSRQINPSGIHREKIGHFGFFRDRCKRSLWGEVSEWLQQH